MRTTARLLILLCLLAGRAEAQNEPQSHPARHEETVAAISKIISDFDKGSPPDLSAFGRPANPFQSQRAPLVDDAPVRVLTDLPEADLAFSKVKIAHEAIDYRKDTLSAFCKEIKEARSQPFGQSKPARIAIMSYRWLMPGGQAPNLRELLDCSAEDSRGPILSTHSKPVFVEMAVAVRGVALLTGREQNFPAWITAKHFLVAALATLPDRDSAGAPFGPTGQHEYRPGCEASSSPPRPILSAADAEKAECVHTDGEGRRFEGTRERRFVPKPTRASHGSASEQDLSQVKYTRLEQGNSLSNWAYVDYGLKDQSIELHVVDKERNAELLQTLCSAIGNWKSLDSRERRRICAWRGGLNRHSDLTPQLWKDLAATRENPARAPVIVSDLAAFLRRAAWYAPWRTRGADFHDFTPQLLLPSGRTRGGEHPLVQSLLSDQNPTSHLIWAYFDPAGNPPLSTALPRSVGL